jgi:2-methylcitrate dehydratase PrpD
MTETFASGLSRLYGSWDSRALSDQALATAKLGFLDVIGCIVGGAPSPTAAMVRELAQAQGQSAEASVLGTALQLSAPLAALVNGVAGHVLDYDDMNATMIAHPSVVLVPAVLALGEARGSSGPEALSAYVLGFEVDACFARIMVPHHYDAGWHSTSSLGIFGATAAASRLLGLEGARMLNALAIAASNSAGLRGNFGSMTKSLHAGQAAEGALRAALLAERGFTGRCDVFDAPGGYFSTYGKNREPRPAPAGNALEIEASGIGIKPYACCGAGVSVMDAALDLRSAHRFDPADITRVDCVVADMAASIMPYREAADGLQAKYCIAYCAAVALLDGKGGLAQFTDERVNRSDVRRLIGQTHVEAAARMASGAGEFGVEMTLSLADGRRLSTALKMPRGHPNRPLDDSAQLDKFLECAAPGLGEERARRAASLLRSLEAHDSLRPLIACLRP